MDKECGARSKSKRDATACFIVAAIVFCAIVAWVASGTGLPKGSLFFSAGIPEGMWFFSLTVFLISFAMGTINLADSKGRANWFLGVCCALFPGLTLLYVLLVPPKAQTATQ
ncbi:MAG: hypothetical protein ABL949_01765 [Fimbriimonadaceae bacterium]